MALTVEPGCYVRPGEGVPEHFWNIGVRIEDDVVVNAAGCEILTRAAPKRIDEIEAVMRDTRGPSSEGIAKRSGGGAASEGGGGGGGRVGPAAAVGRGGMGLDVALVEPAARPSAAFRPIALSHGSRQILEGFGLFGRFAATPIETIHVSQAGGFGRTVIRREDHGVPALGYVCDASALAAVLAEVTSAQRLPRHAVRGRAGGGAVRLGVHPRNG